MIFAFPTTGSLGNDCQVEVGGPSKSGVNIVHMPPEVDGRSHDVARGSTVTLPARAVGRVNNSLGGGHGLDSIHEGLLDVNPYKVLRHIYSSW